MRPRVVVVDHYDSYTWNLVHLVAAVTGELPAVVEHDRVEPDDLTAYSHVVLSPGPGHPAREQDFAVGRALVLGGSRPVLGVCLGMQGMVVAYGGVGAAGEPAHGEVARVRHVGRGPVAGLPDPFRAVRYHSLAAVEVPEVFEVLALCDGDAGAPDVVMGIAHREKPLWGVQFHPESVLTEHGLQLVATFLETA